MLIIRFFLVFAGLALVVSLLLGLFLRDRRWFRFAWQLLKFSTILLVMFFALLALGRFLIR